MPLGTFVATKVVCTPTEYVPQSDIRVGQELEIRLYLTGRQAGVCHRTQFRITAPDGAIYDPGADSLDCNLIPLGRQFVRLYFWTTRPRPPSASPWPTLPGTYTVTVQVRETGPGGEQRPDSPVVRTSQFVAR